MTAVPLVSAGVQTWYLSSKPHASPVMYKGSPTTDPGGCSAITVPQPPNGIFWIANEAATCDVTFSAGNWPIHLVVQNAKPNHPFSAEIGEWNGANFISAGIYNGNIPKGTNGETVDFTISANQFTVHQGNWLAFRLMNTHDQGSELGFKPCESSVSSPPSDPGYPVPELSTLILLSVGLLTLAGYVRLRRKKE